MQASASVLENAVEVAKRWTLFYYITDHPYRSKEQPNCYPNNEGQKYKFYHFFRLTGEQCPNYWLVEC